MPKTTSKSLYRMSVCKTRSPKVKLPPEGVSSPFDAANIARQLIGKHAQEVFLILLMDSQNKVVGYEEATTLAVGHVMVDQGGIMRTALVSGARGFITVHQHPSGNVEPSEDDVALWHSLDGVAEIVGLIALDHLVITPDKTWSARNNGRIE